MLGLCATGRLGVFPAESWLGFWSQPDILFFLAGIGIGIVRRSVRTGPDFPVALGVALGCIAVGAGAGFMWGGEVSAFIVLGPAAVAAVAACGLAFEQDRPLLLRTAAKRIGDATFAIYLCHTFMVGPVTKLAASHAPNMSAWVFVPIVFVFSSAFGIAVHHAVERPLIAAWGSVFLPRRRIAATRVDPVSRTP